MNNPKNKEAAAYLLSLYGDTLAGFDFMNTYGDGSAECFIWSLVAKLLEKTSVSVHKGIVLIEEFKSFLTNEIPDAAVMSRDENDIPDMSYFYPGENELYRSLSEEETLHSIMSCDPETSWERYSHRKDWEERLEQLSSFSELFSISTSPDIGSAWTTFVQNSSVADVNRTVNSLRCLAAPLLSYAREWFISQSVNQKQLSQNYEDIRLAIEGTISYLSNKYL